MNMKPLIAFILIVLLLASAVGCSQEPAEAKTSTADSSASSQAEVEETQYPAPEIVDYEGYNFRIYAYEDGYGYLGNFVVDEDNGDAVDSAIYNRNTKIEDEYKIEITATVKTDVKTQLRKCMASGDDFADLTSYCIRWHLAENLIDCAINMLKIDTLRLDAPWWDQDFNSEFTINGVLQSSVGDIIGTDEVCTTAYLFNQAILGDVGHKSDELYGAVDDGSWTFDKLLSFSSDAAADVNGDGKMDSEDRFGLSYDTGTMWGLFVGAGYDTMEKTSDGGYKITLDSERAYDIFLGALQLFSDKTSIHLEDGKTAINSFKNGHTLFIPFLLGNNNQLRDMTDDYGIIPVPKYEESQDKYYSEASIWTNTIFIPITVGDSSRTGLIIEALAYESQFSFQKAVFDVLLMEKYARDAQSQKMLSLIFSSKKWSLDIAADISGFRSVLGDLSVSGKDTFSSSVAAALKKVDTKLKKFTDDYAELAKQ